MPNHCDSDLYITGPDAQLDQFIAKYVLLEGPKQEATLNLDAILPYPEEFKERDAIAKEWQDRLTGLRQRNNPTDAEWKEIYQQYVTTRGPYPKDGFNSGGYEWCISHWGTKWGTYNGHPLEHSRGEHPDHGIGEVTMRFETAWSPFNTGLLVVVSREFPELRFQYDAYEAGMGFQFHFTCENGEIQHDSTTDYRGPRGG